MQLLSCEVVFLDGASTPSTAGWRVAGPSYTAQTQAACCLELRTLQRDGCFCQRAFLGYLAQFEQLRGSMLAGSARMCDVRLSIDSTQCSAVASQSDASATELPGVAASLGAGCFAFPNPPRRATAYGRAWRNGLSLMQCRPAYTVVAGCVAVSGTLVFHALDVSKLDSVVFATFFYASVQRCLAKRAAVDASAIRVVVTAADIPERDDGGGGGGGGGGMQAWPQAAGGSRAGLWTSVRFPSLMQSDAFLYAAALRSDPQQLFTFEPFFEPYLPVTVRSRPTRG